MNKWRVKCQCKHTHEEHDPNGAHRSVIHHGLSLHMHRRHKGLLFCTATCTWRRHLSLRTHTTETARLLGTERILCTWAGRVVVRCRSCGCNGFNAASACVGCDRKWQDHETYYEVHTHQWHMQCAGHSLHASITCLRGCSE